MKHHTEQGEGSSTSGWAVYTNIEWLIFAKSCGLHTGQELSAVVFLLLSGAIFSLHILPLAFNKHHPSHPRSACPRPTLLLSPTSSFFFPPLRFIWTGLSSSSRSAAALHICRTWKKCTTWKNNNKKKCLCATDFKPDTSVSTVASSDSWLIFAV